MATTFTSTLPGRSSVFASSFKSASSAADTRNATAAAQNAFAQSICSKLEYLNAADVALLTTKAKPMFFAPRESLIKEGAVSPGFYMIRSGEAEVRRGNTTLAKLQAGDVCGEMSFLEDSVASASVIAGQTATAEFISATELHGIFASFPHLASRFYRSMALTLSRRLRATSQQLCAAQAATGK
jgi:CRP/FNR family transcriptional regulator, cyclic AMP receptor protein